MPKKTDDWKPTCKRFVAFLDIMGFKDMVLRNSHEDVYKMLKSFSPAVAAVEWAAKRDLKAKDTKATTRPVIFSDSIILISSDDSKEAANDILFNVRWIFYNAILREIPIKGAIAYGEQTADFKKSLHFGKPLIDAYELQNEILLYSAVLHHTMEKRIIELNMIEIVNDDNIFKYPVPMKAGKITHYIVDWTWSDIREEQIDMLSGLYYIISGTPRLYVDNTLDFVRWVTDRKAKLAQEKKSPSRPSTKRKQS